MAKTKNITEKFNSAKLLIDLVSFGVKIKSDNVEDISITYPEDALKIKQVGNVLKVREQASAKENKYGSTRKRSKTIKKWSLGSYTHTLTKTSSKGCVSLIEIVVPKEMESIKIDIYNGDADLDDLKLKNLKIYISQGDIFCQNVDAKKCKLTVSDGNIDIAACSFKKDSDEDDD